MKQAYCDCRSGNTFHRPNPRCLLRRCGRLLRMEKGVGDRVNTRGVVVATGDWWTTAERGRPHMYPMSRMLLLGSPTANDANRRFKMSKAWEI
jgi:hypothetical protein